MHSHSAFMGKVWAKIEKIICWYGSAIIAICLVALLLHYFAALFQSVRWPTKSYFWGMLLLTIISRRWATFCIIFLLPLMPELHLHLERILTPKVKYFVQHQGLDLIAGYSIGQWVRIRFFEKEKESLFWTPLPWPLNLLLIIIFTSSILAISRNIWRNGTSINLIELTSNILSFKLLSRTDIFYPISDFIVYGFCGLFIFSLIQNLHKSNQKDDLIFRPILVGLLLSSVFGIFQALTSYGLPQNTYSYRPENFGFGAQAFQPDIHAFAAHMLLGAAGTLGYGLTKFYQGRYRLCIFVFLIWAVSWSALILSKSRASIGLAFIFNMAFIFYLLYKARVNKLLIASTIMSFTLIGMGLAYFTNNHQWMLNIAHVLMNISFHDYQILNELSRDRLDIHSAAVRMWSNFPLLGIGQGLFYPLSAIKEFSRSTYLVGMGGENAHNYFLQTLAETGLIGFICFSLALLYPYINKHNLSHLYLSSITAIIAVFMGNFYSHSLIIRENLFLFCTFVALAYSYHRTDIKNALSLKINYPRIFSNRITSCFLFFLFIYIAYLCIKEVAMSYGRFPFIYS
jgi:hypothetical protein